MNSKIVFDRMSNCPPPRHLIKNSQKKYNLQYKTQSLKQIDASKQPFHQPEQQCDTSVMKNLVPINQSLKLSIFSNGATPNHKRVNSKSKLFQQVKFKNFSNTVVQPSFTLSEDLSRSITDKQTNNQAQSIHYNDQFPSIVERTKQFHQLESNQSIKHEQHSIIENQRSIYRPMKDLRVAKYNQKFQEYQDDKDQIQCGILTTRNLAKYLRPKREKFEIQITKEIQKIERLNQQVAGSNNIALSKMEEKLKLANFLLNIKQNVFEKNISVEKLIDKFQKQATQQPSVSVKDSPSYKNMMFLSDMQSIFLKKKKMKVQLMEHEVKMAQFMNENSQSSHLQCLENA